MTPDIRMDAAAFKLETCTQWDDAAAGWDRHGPEIRNWLRIPTDAMLEMAGVSVGQNVLDVAAGAGDQTLDIAERVGATGAVVATDISADILEYALENAVRAGHRNARIHVADAAAAVSLLLDVPAPPAQVLGTDDAPAWQWQVMNFLRAQAGQPPLPEPDGPETGRRIANARLRALGWVPQYPSYREGYAR